MSVEQGHDAVRGQSTLWASTLRHEGLHHREHGLVEGDVDVPGQRGEGGAPGRAGGPRW